MYSIAHEYDISISEKNLFDTLEEAQKKVYEDLAGNPSNTRKRFIIEVVEILQNDIAVPPVKALDVRSISDLTDKRKLLAESD